MCTASKNPCFRTGCKVRLRCPESSSHRKLRHRFFYFLAVYIIDDQAETVSQINKGSCDCRTCLRCKYKSCRIFSVTHRKRADFNTYRSFCNSRAYLKHMRLENSFFSRNKVVCIVLHKGSSLCIFYSCCHNLHQADHSRCFPVSLCAEAVAFFHQSLHCKSWKLL